MRTLRIGVLNLSLTIGISLGIALSGILFQELGFYGIYSISVTMYLMGIIYGFIYLKDPKINNAEPTAIENSKKSSLRTSIKNFFDIKHLKNAFGVTFKKGTNNRRFRILTMMLVLMIIMGPMSGEMSVMYLSTRIRFNWNELDYSMFSTFTMVTGFIGTSISLWGFNHKLKMDDTLIAAIACTSKVVGSFVFAFAPNPYIFYMGSVVEIMCGAGNIATRSIFTKLVEPDELGQVSAVVGVFEAFVPMIYTPMYSSFYQATMETFPGAYYLLGGGLTIPAIFIFLWMYKSKKKQAAADQIVEKIQSPAIQENNDLNINSKIVLKIHETSEKNGFSNLAYQADVCEKD